MDFKYIREEIPAFEIPPYKGQRYEAMVPATLDLQERAALAIHSITSRSDPEADYEIYYVTVLGSNPPFIGHWHWDIWNQMLWHDQLPLMRIMSGSDLNTHVEEHWTKVLLHMQAPDGLLYEKIEERPWLAFNSLGTHGASTGDRTSILTGTWGLTILALYYHRSRESLWKETGERLVQGLAANVVDKGDYAYFPQSVIPWTDPTMPNPHMVSHGGWVVHGLLLFFQETGYEPCLELAGKLVRTIKNHGNHFGPDASFRACKRRPGPEAHFYAHVHSLLEILDYALAAGGDQELIEFAQQGFEFARVHGEPRTGYFPELLFRENFQMCETCGLADMIGLGLRLSIIGAGDYWDDVDRWLRNQFVEQQLTHGDWIERRAWSGPHGSSTAWSQTDPRRQRTEGVGDACVGAFTSSALPNDFMGGHNMGFAGCCSGTGSRALYFIWEHILTHEGGKLRVNLLLNRTSPWADIDSYLPYEGQVDVKIKQDVELSIRIPEWVEPEQITCRVDGEVRTVGWQGRYAQVGQTAAGTVAALTFPIEEHTHWVTIEKQPYNLVCKGNEVVNIQPTGVYHPLYQREHYRDNTVHWKKVTRFASDELLYR